MPLSTKLRRQRNVQIWRHMNPINHFPKIHELHEINELLTEIARILDQFIVFTLQFKI